VLLLLCCHAHLALGQQGKVASTAPVQAEGLSFANGLFRQRKFDLAAEEYHRFLASGPATADADEARFGLASARLFQGRYKEARAAFQDFLDKAPHHSRAQTAWYRLGELAYMLGDLADGRKALETFVRTAPKHPHLDTAWTYLGDVCFGLNDLPAARSAYERSLADFPRGRLADRCRYGLGRTLAGLGQTDGALQVLRELAEGGSSDWIDRAWLQIGRVELSAGRKAAAAQSLATLDRVAARSGLKPEAHLLRGEALAGLNRLDEARVLFKESLAEGPEPLACRSALLLATLELEHGRAEAALTTLDEALKRFPQSPQRSALLFRSAESLQKQNRIDEARKRFLDVAAADPRDAWADDAIAQAARLALETGDHAGVLELARSFARSFPDSKLTAEVRLVEARALLASGHAREAVILLEEVLGPDPGKATTEKDLSSRLTPASMSAARYDLAMAYRATEQGQAADAMLARLASASKDSVGANAQFLMGQGMVERGEFAQAIAPLERYLQASPQGDVADAALAHLSTAQVGLKMLAEADRTLGQLATRFPRSKALTTTRLRVAEAELEASHLERARELFLLVLAPGGNDAATTNTAAVTDPAVGARAEVGLGRTLWRLGKPAEAANHFDRFLQSSGASPMAPEVALERAGALAAGGQTDSALAAYKLVGERYPRSRERWVAELARARLLSRNGHPDEAGKIYADLLASADLQDSPNALGTPREVLMAEHAWALVDARKPAEADAVFKTLLRDFPQSPLVVDARFNLAESASQAGDLKEVVRLLAPLLATRTEASRASSPAPGLDTALNSRARVLPLALLRLGRTQIELGDWSAAESALQRLASDYPGAARNREARFLLAEAALRQDHTAAAETIHAALEREPTAVSDPPGFLILVRTRHVQSLVGLKRWKDALAQADALKAELAAGDPAVADLDFARGRALLGMGRPAAARAALQAVITARKGSELAAQAHLMQGETYFHESRFREALREFLQVDILYDAPRWQAAALLEAGKVYERLAQWADAIQTYESLCSRFPNDPRVPEARDRLGAVRKQSSARAESSPKVF
jgi:TolA-binding protein